jgi:zinc transport system substrate-binding protein
MKQHISLYLFSLILFLFVPAPTGAGSQTQSLPIPVFVGIAPHLEFCQRIGGRRIRAEILLPAGRSPALYAPTPDRIRALNQARLYFTLSLPFEKRLLEKLKQLPQHPQIINLQAGIKLRTMQGPAADPTSTHPDPHTWLDPRLAAHQAEIIATALTQIDPGGKSFYAANLRNLQRELEDLDRRLRQALKPLAGSTLLVYHPAFGYFAAAYGLRQLAVESEGKAPKGRALSQLISRARGEKIRVIFVQPQFDRRSAAAIAAAIDGTVIAIDPLARDYCANLLRIATSIRQQLKP